MRVYFAARYSRHPEMRQYRAEIERASTLNRVTSRWIDAHGGEHLVSLAGDQLKDPTLGRHLAMIDLEDIDNADYLIAFTQEENGNSKGGRHVEFGYALAQDKQIIVIGPRENVFYCMEGVDQYNSWSVFYLAWQFWLERGYR